MRKFHVVCKRGAGFYNYDETLNDVLIKIHPIACQTVGQSYRTHQSFWLTDTNNQQGPLPPGFVTYDNLLDGGSEPHKGKAASEGSVHLREKEQQRHG